MKQGRRWQRWNSIEGMDPETEAREILDMFLADFETALSFAIGSAFLVTYAAPTQSRVLYASGALLNDTAKRVADTTILDSTVLKCGFEPGDGRDAMRRINQMHSKWPIVPEDFVFIGCYQGVFLVDNAEMFGWRPVHPKEKAAFAQYQAERFSMMNIKEHPQTFDEMREFVYHYYETKLSFEAQNRLLADAMFDYMKKLLPAPISWISSTMMLASVHPNVVTEIGYRTPRPPVLALARWGWRTVAKLRGPRRPESAPGLDGFIEGFYPDGYKINELGTFPQERVESCPAHTTL